MAGKRERPPDLAVHNQCDDRLRDLDLTQLPGLRDLKLDHCPQLRVSGCIAMQGCRGWSELFAAPIRSTGRVWVPVCAIYHWAAGSPLPWLPRLTFDKRKDVRLSAVKALAWFPEAATGSASLVPFITRGQLVPEELANAIQYLR